MNFPEKIFKAYDIRGVYGQELDEELAFKIGQAYARLLSEENKGKRLQVVVGGDMRISTPILKSSLIKGILQAGIDVVDVGLVSTPTFYGVVALYGYDGGVQVSASHNPKEYNGFKLVRAHAVPISGDTGIHDIKELVRNFNPLQSSQVGVCTSRDGLVHEIVEKEIVEWSIERSKIRPLKIVVDAANAMGALDIDALFSGLPCEIIRLNFELDGSFPSHEADPIKEENLKLLCDAVVKHGADIGIAPDGDGDRYFFVDEKGKIVRQEILRGIMAQLALKKYPGATVCYDIRPGKITEDLIVEAGGKPVVTRVGHSLIKEHMLRSGAIFGGESSGHYFYKFSFGTFEAPTVHILQFLQFISQENRSLSEIIAPHQKYFHSGEINFVVEDKEGKMTELAQHYSEGKVSFLDGVSVEYPDWWFNVRPSNTESLLRLNLEARTKELLDEKVEEVKQIIVK